MKKIFLLSFISLGHFTINAQTTLKYSGTGTFSHFLDNNYKVAGVGDVDALPATNYHIGLVGYGKNGSVANIGVMGSTKPNTQGIFSSRYIAVFGDNTSNNLSINDTDVFGGYFRGFNVGSNTKVYGVKADATAFNTQNTEVYGVDAVATNYNNTTAEDIIGVRGISNSGVCTLNTYLTGVANPGGYFLSNTGQGIYATTTGGYNYSNLGKVSQAVTGYSNQTNMYLNIGVAGIAAGTGNIKYAVYGLLSGTAGTTQSSAITGDDNINAINTYAGLFNGKVKMNGSVFIDGNLTFGAFKTISGFSASFTSTVCASNIVCSSDLRYKKNISPLGNSLNNILKINGVRYDWKQEEFPEKHFSDKNQIGFIAQEIEKIFPEMVFTDEKGFKSVDYARLTPVLVEAIKELNVKNQKLESKNQKLENRLDKIEALLSSSNASTTH
jgi:Chaperone of endosialidase